MVSNASGDPENDDTLEPLNREKRRLRWLRHIGPGGRGLTNTRYLTKWLLLGTTIGLVAGVGAIIFYAAIELVTQLSLGQFAGYLPPSPVGEGAQGIVPPLRPWLLPIVVAVGGLLSGIIVFTLAPEAEGHGTDAAIASIHFHQGRLRARIPPIKLLASAITIGTGGSGGREGPTAQISAGFGSLLSDWLRLSPQDRRIAVAAGIGSGIGAIFRAPLGGAMLAAEIMYIHDLEIEALIPGLISSIVGYTIFGSFFGFVPIFGNQPSLALDAPLQLVYYAVLGGFAGLYGLLYARSFYGVAGFFHRLKLPRLMQPAIGGLLVGLLGLVIPGVLHTGYGWIQVTMDERIFGLPLWMILLLPFAKILATSLSIGSGGSGGIFGPGMVIGGLLGASFWRVGFGVLPQFPDSPAPMVIVGMMAMFGGIAHAPLAVMLMVAEMTGNLSLLAPAMVAVAVSTALVGNTTIYRSQLPNRASAPAHRVRFSFPLLSALLVRDAMAEAMPVLRSDDLVSAAEPFLESSQPKPVVVVDERNLFKGVVDKDQIQTVPQTSRDWARLGPIARAPVVVLDPEQPLDIALESLVTNGATWAPVLDEKRAVGRVSVRDIVKTYKTTLARSVRRTRELPIGTALFEVRLGQNSPLAGQTLRDSRLPRDTLVVSISRDGETIFPRATTRLEPGDRVMIMTNPETEAALRSFLEGAPPTK